MGSQEEAVSVIFQQSWPKTHFKGGSGAFSRFKIPIFCWLATSGLTRKDDKCD